MTGLVETDRPPTREAADRAKAIKLLRAGLATQSEIARLAGVDRQLVAYWVAQAGIDVASARETRLRKMWR